MPRYLGYVIDHKIQVVDTTEGRLVREEDAPNKPLKRNRHLCDCAEYLASKYLRPGRDDIVVPEGWSAELVQAVQNKVRQRGDGRKRGGLVEGIPV